MSDCEYYNCCVQIPSARRLPVQFVDAPITDGLRVLHPALELLQGAGTSLIDEPFDAVSVKSAAVARQNAHREQQARLVRQTGELVREFDRRLPRDPVNDGAVSSALAAESPSSPTRASKSDLLSGPSPLRFAYSLARFAAAAAVEAIAAPVASIMQLLQSRGPLHTTEFPPRALETAPAVEQVVKDRTLFLEPESMTDGENYIERIVRQFSSQYHNHQVPASLSFGDRFLLWYGAYVINGELLPPLWLAQHGNPAQIWG